MIQEKEYKAARRRLVFCHISRFLISAVAVLSVLSIFFVFAFPWLIPLTLFTPGSIILKYVFKVKNVWILNDYEGNDSGQKWWLKKKGLKPGLITSILWWFRNHSWNYYKKFDPDWNAGQVYEYELRINTTEIPGRETIWVWCSKYATKNNPPIYGEHLLIYRVFEGGKVWFRHSKASPNKELQFGYGGNEYRWRKKPII